MYQKLVVSSKAVVDRICAILGVYLRLAEQGDIVPTKHWDELPNRQKVILFLLSRRAAYEQGMVNEIAVSARDIARQTGVKAGSVRPVLRDLVRDGIVQQDAKQRYLLPLVNLGKVEALFEQGEEPNGKQ